MRPPTDGEVRPYFAGDFDHGTRGHKGYCSNNGCLEWPEVQEWRIKVGGGAWYAHCQKHRWSASASGAGGAAHGSEQSARPAPATP